MSSKGGPRASGSDGSDFQHREQVASQYKISAQLKSKFRTCLLINIAVVVVQVLAFAAAHFNLFESASDYHPAHWQFTWMLSGVVSLIGLSALGKNKGAMLSLHNLGMTMFGLGGIFFGAMSQFASYKRHITFGQTNRVADVPVYVIWIAFLALLVPLYAATFYYSIRLQAAWNVRKAR